MKPLTLTIALSLSLLAGCQPDNSPGNGEWMVSTNTLLNNHQETISSMLRAFATHQDADMRETKLLGDIVKEVEALKLEVHILKETKRLSEATPLDVITDGTITSDNLSYTDLTEEGTEMTFMVGVEKTFVFKNGMWQEKEETK